jgi:hypothetical protein
MTTESLDADTGEKVFCEPGDLTPYSQPSVSPLAKPTKTTKPWVAMRELLITYLGISVSIALLLTGPMKTNSQSSMLWPRCLDGL